MTGTTYFASGQPVTADELNQTYAFSDSTAFTVTAASFNPLTNSWTIAAGEPIAGSTYRVRAYGIGTQGSTAQSMSFAASFGGVTTGTGLAFANTFAGTSAAFHWEMEAEAMCISTGSGGTWQLSLSGSCGSGTSTTLTGTAQNSTAITVSTVAAISFFIEAEWGSVTGAPTTTGTRSVFQRVC